VLLQVKAAGWKVHGDIVLLPLNSFNQAVQKHSQDLISYDTVAPVLRHALTTP